MSAVGQTIAIHDFSSEDWDEMSFSEQQILIVETLSEENELPSYTSKEGESVWQDICNQQGWNESSQIIHLEGFLRDKGLFGEFAAYAEVVAKEENSY